MLSDYALLISLIARFLLLTAASSSGKKTSLCMLYLGYAWNRLTLFDLDYVQLKFLLYVSNLNKCLCLLL